MEPKPKIPRRIRSSPHARKALGRTALVVVLMLAVSYVLSNNLLGPFSVFLKGPQSGALDQLSRATHRWASPVPIRGFPLVVLVDLERESVKQLSPQGYVFNRGEMARITQKILEYKPKGVFYDFDFAEPTNEGGMRSAGDQKLLEAMQQTSYPILLPDPQMLGLPLAKINPNLHAVAAQVLYDGDGQTRFIPRPTSSKPLAASVGLYCLGMGYGVNSPACLSLVSSGNPKADGKRIVFRDIQRFSGSGQQLWPGLVVLSGLELLQGGLVKTEQTEGALFLVGRTFPAASDAHFTPIGAVQGIDIHLNALMTLATYRHFSESLSWGPVLLLVPLLVFLALWLTYSISDGLLQGKRLQSFIKSLIETAITAWFLFFAGVFILQYYGYYLDYLYPIVAFQMGSLLLNLFKGGKANEPTEDKGEAIAEHIKELSSE